MPPLVEEAAQKAAEEAAKEAAEDSRQLVCLSLSVCTACAAAPVPHLHRPTVLHLCHHRVALSRN